MQQLKRAITILALSLFAFTSCSKDDDQTSSSTSNVVSQGKWKITLFNDSGNDETNHFTGYEFSFNSNGTVNAVKSPNTVNGTWSTGTDDSQNKFILNLGSIDPFEDISEDWHILEKTASKIRLEHVSGGNGGTDLLTFEKI